MSNELKKKTQNQTKQKKKKQNKKKNPRIRQIEQDVNIQSVGKKFIKMTTKGFLKNYLIFTTFVPTHPWDFFF